MCLTLCKFSLVIIVHFKHETFTGFLKVFLVTKLMLSTQAGVNWSNIFIPVCTCKEFSLILEVIVWNVQSTKTDWILEPYFWNNFTYINFLEGEILHLIFSKENKSCLHRHKFFIFYKFMSPKQQFEEKYIQNNAYGKRSLRVFFSFFEYRNV